MPSSHKYQLNEISELIALTDPKSTLDIGIGFGKYGFLAREYLELWDGREKYNDWKRQIDGIEACKDYITPIHDLIYDQIYIGNAINILSTLKENYDLILLIDIIEHFTYDEGMKLLGLCEKHGRNIVISTPLETSDQGSTFGNPYETHKFQWKKKHFEKFTTKFFLPNAQSLIIYIGEDANKVKSKIKVRTIFQIKTLFQYLLI